MLHIKSEYVLRVENLGPTRNITISVYHTTGMVDVLKFSKPKHNADPPDKYLPRQL